MATSTEITTGQSDRGNSSVQLSMCGKLRMKLERTGIMDTFELKFPFSSFVRNKTEEDINN